MQEFQVEIKMEIRNFDQEFDSGISTEKKK